MKPLIELEPWPDKFPPAKGLSSGDFRARYPDQLEVPATPRLWEYDGEKVTGR